MGQVDATRGSNFPRTIVPLLPAELVRAARPSLRKSFLTAALALRLSPRLDHLKPSSECARLSCPLPALLPSRHSTHHPATRHHITWDQGESPTPGGGHCSQEERACASARLPRALRADYFSRERGDHLPDRPAACCLSATWTVIREGEGRARGEEPAGRLAPPSSPSKIREAAVRSCSSCPASPSALLVPALAVCVNRQLYGYASPCFSRHQQQGLSWSSDSPSLPSAPWPADAPFPLRLLPPPARLPAIGTSPSDSGPPLPALTFLFSPQSKWPSASPSAPASRTTLLLPAARSSRPREASLSSRTSRRLPLLPSVVRVCVCPLFVLLHMGLTCRSLSFPGDCGEGLPGVRLSSSQPPSWTALSARD